MRPQNRQRILVAEATVRSILCAIELMARRQTTIFARCATPLRRADRFAIHQIDWVSWAVLEAAKTNRFNLPDLAYAIAAERMLRHRGIAGRLCIGFATDRNEAVPCVWAEAEGTVVFGREHASDATVLASYAWAAP